MLRALLISMTLVLALPAMAQAAVTPADRQAITAKADTFFLTLNKGQTAKAYTTSSCRWSEISRRPSTPW